MPEYRKTIYVDFLSDNPDDTLGELEELLMATEEVTYVDLEGPIEELPED
jgi:hypothetical protein